MNSAFSPTNSPLGKHSAYITQYDPSLLFPIPRQAKRDEIGITGTLPFFGIDIWNAYEISWLNAKGRPEIAIGTFTIPADSSHLIESKSLKLYLNSFNQTKMPSVDFLVSQIQKDLSLACHGNVGVELITPNAFDEYHIGHLKGLLLDRLDIEVDTYHPNPSLLTANHHEAPVEETLVSHLLKSNCLVTGQPDWGSVQIQYAGAQIDQENLLRYLIGFREHNEFHEQCVERIFMDILTQCKPQHLSVYARYTRRGGLDINPWRSNFSTATPPQNIRLARQ